MSLHRRFALALAAATALVVTGCGSDDPGDRVGGSSAEGAAGAPAGDAPAGDVPEECGELYPFAHEAPDLADVKLLPADFPEPPVDATLCEAGGAGEGQEYAAYATSAGAEEVLAAYEDALASYDAVRAEDGLGNPIVNATAGDVAVQVSTKDGGFSLVFTRA